MDSHRGLPLSGRARDGHTAIPDDSQGRYHAYLKSGAWAARSEGRRQRDRYTCCRCGWTTTRGGRGLEVHHVTYVRRGRELMEDLRTLCTTCHRISDGHYEGNARGHRPALSDDWLERTRRSAQDLVRRNDDPEIPF